MFTEFARIKSDVGYKGLKHIDEKIVEKYNSAIEQHFYDLNFAVDNAEELTRLVVEGWVEFYQDEIILNVDM